MNIVFCLGSMGKGGAERVIANLSNYLADKDNLVSIITTVSSTSVYTLNKKIKHYSLENNLKKNNSLNDSEKNILVKTKNTEIQSSLNKTNRLNNIKGAFKIQNAEKIRNKKVIIFDDIYTTGATANECAKIVKQAGVKEVSILTIAKD